MYGEWLRGHSEPDVLDSSRVRERTLSKGRQHPHHSVIKGLSSLVKGKEVSP